MTRYPEIKHLIEKVELKYGKRVLSPKEFEKLSESILTHAGGAISPSSLRRIWGYDHYSGTFRLSTLDILARYIGENSFPDFSERIRSEPGFGSDFLTPEMIRSNSLQPGETIRVDWNPGRSIILEYIGDNRYRVLESINSKLQAGDSFDMTAVVKGYAMYVTNVRHQGEEIPFYAAGLDDGITLVKKLS